MPERRDEAAASPHQRRRYDGLSELFLAARAPKLLLLAGTDRLDRPLTIGQMQGRFQLALLPQARAASPSCRPPDMESFHRGLTGFGHPATLTASSVQACATKGC